MLRVFALLMTAMACGPSLQLQVAATVVAFDREPSRNPAELRADYAHRTYPTPEPVSAKLAAKAAVRESTVRGGRVFTFVPKAKASHWHIIYVHGGSFVHDLVSAHWDVIEALIDATGATVTAPSYPLAPEHQGDETFAMLEQLYRDLLAQGVAAKDVVLCGDSAGGNLSLVQALRDRDLGLPLPAHIILFSPWVDLTMSNPQVKYLQLDDPMLHWWESAEYGKWWAGERRREPYFSPINADLKSLPPVQIYQGSRDIFAADARLLRDRLTAAGIKVSYHETEGGFHDFMAATFTPEARAVYRQIATELGP